MEQQGFADSRRLRDFPDGTLFIGILRKYPKTGIDDRVLFFLRQGKKLIVHAVPPFVDRFGQSLLLLYPVDRF